MVMVLYALFHGHWTGPSSVFLLHHSSFAASESTSSRQFLNCSWRMSAMNSLKLVLRVTCLRSK